MIKIINIKAYSTDKQIFDQAIKHLINGGLIIYPTDTSYGLGALYTNVEAIERIYLLKNRNESKKLSVVVPGIQWIKNNLETSSSQEEILRKYLPGKYTFILKCKNNDDNLGVRIPDNNFIQTLAKKIGEPITATSANLSGCDDCYSLEDLQKGILQQSELFDFDIIFFNAGKLKKDRRSTVVDLTKTPPEILRQGSGKFPK